MIRHRRGNEFLLIKQHDHALLSGEFAKHLGNDTIDPPSPYRETIEGISLHDSGWPLHDDEGPTLNGKGEPLHVLESPMSLAVRVWGESARRAAEGGGPYCGLLVSLHVMNLSAIAQRNDLFAHERARDDREFWDLHKFQHAQIEFQETLRRALGLRTDLPLKMGLAKPGAAPAEDALAFNFGLLRAMDQLSLDLCCSEPLFEKIENVYPRPGAEPFTIRVTHNGPGAMSLDPWPFNTGRLEFETPCRRLPVEPFKDEATFRAAYAAAPAETYRVTVTPS